MVISGAGTWRKLSWCTSFNYNNTYTQLSSYIVSMIFFFYVKYYVIVRLFYNIISYYLEYSAYCLRPLVTTLYMPQAYRALPLIGEQI